MKQQKRSLNELFRLAGRAEMSVPAETEEAWRELRHRVQEPALKRLRARVQRLDEGSKLMLATRSDVLVLLLWARGRFGRLAEGICGTTRILKLLFLAGQELGTDRLVRAAYEFQPYKLGPFCASVYDDVEVLVRAGLVKRETVDTDGTAVIQRDERMAAELALLNGTIQESREFTGLSTVYRLSGRGRRFARALERSGTRRKPLLMDGLALLKAQYGSMTLRRLLRYIYTRYPEYATESEIREKILGRK